MFSDRKKKEKHVIYETTCNVNGKKYIGMHSTNDINDDYLGSGLLLNRAIAKYNIDNFSKQILFIFDTYEEMQQKEIELITTDIVDSNKYYNIMVGGQGGAQRGEVAKKISKKITEVWAGRNKEERTRIIKKGIPKRPPPQNFGANNPMYGKTHTEKSRIKMRESSKIRDRTIHKFIHNNGDIFIGEISEFYKKHELDRAWVSRVVRGIKKTIKGWTYAGKQE